MIARSRAARRTGSLLGAIAVLAVIACNEDRSYQGRSADQWASALTSREPQERARAADALYQIRPTSPVAVRALVVAMRDSSAMVQVAVAAALSVIGSRGVPALIAALQDDHADVRAMTASVLGGLGEAAAPAVAGLARAVGDPSPEVSASALNGLQRLGRIARSAVPALADFMRRSRAPTWGEALHALVTIGADSSVTLPLIRAAARDTAWRFRAAAARALGAMVPRTGPAARLLVQTGLPTDPDPRVRLAAVVSLSQHGLSTPGVSDALTHALADPDSIVRRYAYSALHPPPPERERD
jgi:HEAT repeat protein